MEEPVVHGVGLERHTASRCAHWQSELDVLALLAPCCSKFYACASCHDACEEHALVPWADDTPLETKALLCGVCQSRIAIIDYMDPSRPSVCPACSAGFNPGCKTHWNIYFSAVLIENATGATMRKQ